jgi:hypothetical protein
MIKAKYSIYDSAILDAPIEEVWPVVRDILQILPIVFGDQVKDCRWVEGGSAEHVPARFQFTLVATGETPLEEVVGRSETEHSLTYRMLGQAVGIEGYIATYRLRPVTNEPGKTFIEWPRDFSVVEGKNPAEVAPFLASLATQEVAAMKKYFERRGHSKG